MDFGLHIPHPHLENRKDFLKRHREGVRGLNNRLALRITGIVGTMWCAYGFAALALISLPEAAKMGTSALIAWIAQTFLQLVLLSIIMVGQKVAAGKSDLQLEHTFMDAEALLKISDDMHRLLKTNHKLTEQINELISRDKEPLPS